MKRTFLANLIALALAGCFLIQGHAEMVKRDRNGGVLAIKGDRDKGMEDAKSQMAANCADGYEIVGEEMVKVGEETVAGEETERDHQKSSTSSSAVTSEVKEYRITYECKGSEPENAGGEEESAAEDT